MFQVSKSWTLILSLVTAVLDPIGVVALFIVKAQDLLENLLRFKERQRYGTRPQNLVINFMEWSSDFFKLIDLFLKKT